MSEETKKTERELLSSESRALLLFQSKSALQAAPWLNYYEFSIAWGHNIGAVTKMVHDGKLEAVHPKGSKKAMINNTAYRFEHKLFTPSDLEDSQYQNEINLADGGFAASVYGEFRNGEL